MTFYAFLLAVIKVLLVLVIVFLVWRLGVMMGTW
jgi:hypothetical protein